MLRADRRRLIVACVVVSACPSLYGGPGGSVGALADRYWEVRLARFPTMATFIGDHRYGNRLEDLSEDERRTWRVSLTGLLDDVRRINPEPLSSDDRLTRELLERAITDELLRLDAHLEYLALDPLEGPHIAFPLLLVSQPFRHRADFDAYVARLAAFPVQVDQLLANLRAGMKAGITPPKVTIAKVLPQLRTHIVKDVAHSEFFKPIEDLTKLSQEDRAAVRAAISAAITDSVVPAYRKLLAFVEGEYLPACRETVGIGSAPGGQEIYRKLAYLNTTVSLTADEIHQTGLSEVARIREAMGKVQAEVGYEGTLDDFLTFMRTDQRFRFTSAEELQAAAGAILERTKPLMPKLFGRLPKADCVMMPIESFRAASSPMAYYNPTPEDGSRPGYFYINLYRPNERLRFTLEALAYHESIPGHHFQIALDQENRSLPSFRRYASFTAYVEGWALYTEKLGYEIGGYRDAYSRFGQLTFEMWRACRLVVDTGMHVQSWTRQRAIDYMVANTSMSQTDIEAEVDRYIAWPGQALAYKIGELRIVRLRREAEARLGDAFDLRTFHDALLAGGAMPIDVLERRMRVWIGAQAR